MPNNSQTVLDNIAFVEKSRIKIINLVCIISALLALLSAFIGRDSLPYSISLITLSCIFIGSLLMNFNSKTSLTKYFVPLATTIWITYMCIAFGNRLGTQNYLVIALVALAIYAKNKTYRTISILVILATALSVNIYQNFYEPLYSLPKFIDLLSAVNVLTPLIIISMICWTVISDAAKSNAIIQQQKRDLADSNQFKDKVLSIIGHDMRSPFNSAKSLIYLLENELLSKEEKHHVLALLHSDIDLSLQTLDNILEWASQAYYGSVMQTKIKKETLKVKEMVDTAIEGFTQLSLQKQVTMSNSIDPATRIYADRQQIAFVLRNLTSNALKFSHSDQHIIFSSSENDGKVTICVKDQGIGMSTEMQSSLFQISNRFSEKGTANEKGSGLGLIFCQEFIENNNGNLWIESKVGKGTTINFSLNRDELVNA
ncbi:HAMP domain-containing histidine kinase [Pedobacter polaris]|uniref:histidine kinase n=1 Tax=Pedobacter polaris TaxID=2571273 RepID=A0A4U1CQG1_9SPHI|nr:HAMP domain-containing sensor histidine kinase [Pedobacter polaris]TKC09904.1 HAMP domain-containing histidine kinase [Pedobacter polaris]